MQLPDHPPQVPRYKTSRAQAFVLYRESVCLGEWTESEVRKLYAEGLLFPTDYYWREGMEQWRRLKLFFQHAPRPSIFEAS